MSIAPMVRRPDSGTQAGSSSPTALIYLRVSTKEQAEAGGEAEGYSIPAQRAACERKAESLGAMILDQFVDAGESARSANRPALQALLAYVATNPVTYVIVHKLDRLARNRFDDVEINLAFQQAGVKLVSCSENIDETPNGMLLHGIMSSIAEFYSRNLANEAIKGMTQKAMVGGTPTKAPIGYANVRKTIDGREVRTVDLDPERATLITTAFELYATGDWTLQPLLNEMTIRGLTSQASRKRPSKPLVLSQFHRVLRNPYYVGKIIWRGIEYQGLHTPIVSKETFDRVQMLLSSRSNAGEREVQHNHYLKGSVFCGGCRSRFMINMAHGRGGVYPYFVCLGRHRKRTDCIQKSLLIDEIEAGVEGEWRKLKFEPNYAQLVKDLLREDLLQRRTASERQAAVSKRRIQSLNEERTKLLRAHYDGAVPLDLVRSEMTRIGDELKQHEQRIAATEQHFLGIENLICRAIDFLRNLADTYDRADEKTRRQLNQGMFERIYFRDGPESRVDLAEPFRTLMDPRLVINLRKPENDDEATWDEAGLPVWLRSHKWWTAGPMSKRKDSPGNTFGGASLGLGLNSVLLVPPTGFEPVLPP